VSNVGVSLAQLRWFGGLYSITVCTGFGSVEWKL
jgi:hypothetical protein